GSLPDAEPQRFAVNGSPAKNSIERAADGDSSDVRRSTAVPARRRECSRATKRAQDLERIGLQLRDQGTPARNAMLCLARSARRQNCRREGRAALRQNLLF